MLIIFGWRSSVARVAMVTLLCHLSQRPAAHPLDKVTRKLTLFFVPLFPISTRYVLTCTACGFSQRVTKSDAENLVARYSSGVPA